MTAAEIIFALLRDLEAAKIHYHLARHDDQSITVEAAVPGERWEIQIFPDGSMQGEKFLSDGSIVDEATVRNFIRQFSD